MKDFGAMKNVSRPLAIFAALLLTLVLVADLGPAIAQSNCVNGPPPDATAGAADVDDQTIQPCDVDPACDNPGGQPHRVFLNTALPTADLEEELVVILPGVGQNPTNIEWLGRASAYAGYRTIVLAYEGNPLEICVGSADYNHCAEQFRENVLFGAPSAPAPSEATYTVQSIDSIEQRLVGLLTYLNGIPLVANWDDIYLPAGELAHDKIIISGYSLGSGHAAYWAKLERFAGVVTISGPTDHYPARFPFDRTLHPSLYYPLGNTNTIAAWIREPNPATPGVFRYGAFHVQEAPLDKLDAIILGWDNFGLPRLPDKQHLVLDVTDGYDFTARQPWPLSKWEHRFSFNTPIPSSPPAPPDCTGHKAAAADACLELDAGSGLPLVFPLYMNMFCAAGGDLP